MLIDFLEQLLAVINVLNPNVSSNSTSTVSSTNLSTLDNSTAPLQLLDWLPLQNASETIITPSRGQYYQNETFFTILNYPTCCDYNYDDLTFFTCTKNASFAQRVQNNSTSSGTTNVNKTVQSLFPLLSPNTHIVFQQNVPSCVKGNEFIKIHLNNNDKGDEVGHRAEKRTRFLATGYLGYNNEFYSPEQYCINRLTGDHLEVRICHPECSAQRPCIQKCCDPDEIYSFAQRRCIKSNPVSYNPIFYKDMSHPVERTGGDPDKVKKLFQPHFSIRFPRSFKFSCQRNTTQIIPSGNQFASYLSNFTGQEYHHAEFHLRQDGVIMYRRSGKAFIRGSETSQISYREETDKKCFTLKTNNFCIDGATEYGNPDGFMNHEGDTFLATCGENLYEPQKIGPLSFVYGNVMITSSFFSLLTILAYLILKEKRENIQGWTVISYATSMFFMYVFLGLAHLIRYYGSNDVLKTNACVFIGIATHLFSLASFLWLTMMNGNLWYTFRKIRPTATANPYRDSLWQTYLKYSIVGWGIPLMIISVSSYLHFSYEQIVEDDCAETPIPIPLPAYGRESCEIKQLSLGVYLYFPATVLLLCNLLFFMITTYSLFKHQRGTGIAVKRLERQHQSVQLFGKLFFVMGVTRVFEVVTWFVGESSEPVPTVWYWAALDIFNVLQAVAVFIIYVCKQDTLRALLGKFARTLSRIEGFLFNGGKIYRGKSFK